MVHEPIHAIGATRLLNVENVSFWLMWFTLALFKIAKYFMRPFGLVLTQMSDGDICPDLIAQCGSLDI